MKQNSSRVLTERTENGSFGNAQAQERKRILPEGANRKRFADNITEADRRGPHVRFEKFAGARRLRRSPVPYREGAMDYEPPKLCHCNPPRKAPWFDAGDHRSLRAPARFFQT